MIEFLQALQIFEKEVFNYRRTINKNHNNYSPCLGCLVGYIIRKTIGERAIGSAEQKAKNLILDAEHKSETIKKEITIEGKKKPTGSEAKPSARYANEDPSYRKQKDG